MNKIISKKLPKETVMDFIELLENNSVFRKNDINLIKFCKDNDLGSD